MVICILICLEKLFFQQTGFSKVTITSTGIGIGTETPTFPLHITSYVASTQTYKSLIMEE